MKVDNQAWIIRNRRLPVLRFEAALWRKVRPIIESEHPDLLSEATMRGLHKEDNFDWENHDAITKFLNKGRQMTDKPDYNCEHCRDTGRAFDPDNKPYKIVCPVCNGDDLREKK